MANKTIIQPVKGTRDFYPEIMCVRKWLFDIMRQTSESFGYEEYDGPILEPLSLYAAKSGEELVNNQTFQILEKDDKKIALRPELTPTLARMVAQKENQLTKPIRWFSIGPRFRYEQPQKGRTREFYQWDIDLIGLNNPEADAEMLILAATFLKNLGLTPEEVKIKVNNRKFMNLKLEFAGIEKEKISDVFKAIDKMKKMEVSAWKEYLMDDIKLTVNQIENLDKVLKDKDFSAESPELTQIFSTLKDFGYENYVEFDPTIVRGLAYYTGTIFEAEDGDGEFRSILGGGRYDNLVEVVGGNPLPGVGFAAGDVVLELVLRKFNKIPPLPISPTKILITVFDESLLRSSFELTRKLRTANINCEIYLDSTVKLDKQLKYADQKGIPFVAILGPDEITKNVIALKNLSSKEQVTLPFDELLKILL